MRRGMTLVEILVVLAIIGVLCGLIIPAAQAVRATAAQAKCLNNLRQLGIASLNHEATYKYFPVADEFNKAAPAPKGSMFSGIHPFVESNSAVYRCPSRYGRPVDADDYASSQHPQWYRDPQLAVVVSVGGGLLFPVYNNTLPGYEWRPAWRCRMRAVSDGLSNTLLLAHKGVRPEYYGGGSPSCPAVGGDNTDTTFMAVPPSTFEQRRSDRHAWQRDHEATNDWQCNMTSPHRLVMPVVFADGSAKTLPFSWSQNEDRQARGWGANDAGIMIFD